MAHEADPPDEPDVADPISVVFPSDDPAARFVASMSMASNDLDRTTRDILSSGVEDRPDFSYRVRVSVCYLVEAIDSLDAYCREFHEVRTLIARMPTAAKDDLKIVRGTLQKAGAKTLQRIRHNTFHYPSPGGKYNPTSDELLRDALAGMGDRGAEFHIDGDTGAVTLTFADDAALAVSLGAATEDEVRQRIEVARDGALAFTRWAAVLLVTYRDAYGHIFGTPLITKRKAPTDPT